MTERPRGEDGADARRALAETRAWVERAVIGLNLCPFARAVEAKGRIRYVHCESADPEALLERLREEMRRLAAADPASHETTLIVHPHVLEDFLDYNDFLDRAEDELDALGYAGTLQIASFHPNYQFAGTAPDDPGNATNRSPYPTLHLLRIERQVVAQHAGRLLGGDLGENGDVVENRGDVVEQQQEAGGHGCCRNGVEPGCPSYKVGLDRFRHAG